MRFSYQPYDVKPTPATPGASNIHRPVIPVRISGRASSAIIWSLLDTGADESYITEEMAEYLGVESIGEETYGIESASGEVSARYGICNLEVRQSGEVFARRVTIGIVPETWSEPILGHAGFLEFFDARFSHAEKTVELWQRTPLGKQTL